MEKEIKYIGFYDIPNSEYRRVCSVPAVNKMDYICDAINRAGHKVHIISPSWFDNSSLKGKFSSASTKELDDNKRLTLAPSFETSMRGLGYFKIILSLGWLFFWLVFNVKKNEKILVYHAQWFSLPIRWAKQIKKFHLILEVEEIYGEVWQTKNTLQKWEQKLIKNADSFLAVSDVLAKILGDKVQIVIYGNYALPHYKENPVKGKGINIVYAGSIDHTKGGAYNTVKCAGMLPENYNIHICGFGDDNEVRKLKEMIVQINEKLSRKAVIFHGAIPDEFFSDFLHSCQIAINPQKEGENMTTLFPSKIIKYLSHNLRVVSTRIESIDKSAIAPLITFSENDSPESIVAAILQLDLNEEYNSKMQINKLDEKFVKGVKFLFGSY